MHERSDYWPARHAEPAVTGSQPVTGSRPVVPRTTAACGPLAPIASR